jgi:RecB family exonuclease
MTLMELRKRRHVSASQINQLLNVCSLQFYFERIAKLKKPFVSHSLVFGTCVHRTLEHYFRWLKAGESPDRDSHLDMFSELWKKATKEQKIKFGSRDDAESLAVKGRNMIGCFIDNIDPAEKVLSVSQAFCVPVHAPDGSVVEDPLVGEFDMLVERDGETVIVDFKTAARKWAEGQAHKNFQATVYSYAWNQMTGERPPIRFDVVTKTKLPSYEQHETRRSERQEQRMAMLISKAQQIVKHELYVPAETGFYCGDCPYAGPCKDWGCKSTSLANVA